MKLKIGDAVICKKFKSNHFYIWNDCMYEIIGQKVYVDDIDYLYRRCYVNVNHLETETCVGTYYFPLSHVKKISSLKSKLK